MDRSYFFDKGLRFKCRQCVHCCTGDPGTIYVNDEEIRSISRHLKMARNKFVQKYLYPFKDSFSIREKPNGDCVFYRKTGCRIYSVRPQQCRTYPFWIENLRTEKRWQHTQKECPGAGRGRLYPKARILDLLS